MEVNASLFKQNLQGESDGHPIKSYLNVHICVWYSILDIVFWSVMTAVPMCCYVCTKSWQQLAELEKRFLVDVWHVWQQCYVSKIHQWNACLYFAFVLVYLGSVLTVARYQEHVPPRPEESLPSTESWSLKRECLQCWFIMETFWLLDYIQIISNVRNIPPALLSVQC